MKKGLRIFSGIAFTLLILGIVSIKPVDYSGYEDKDYYLESSGAISLLKPDTSTSEIRIGWSQQSITPAEPVRLTGLRRTPYERIQDSVYLRTFAFSDGKQTVVLLIYDLWIIHPRLANTIRESVLENFNEVDHIYFSATHTHSSIGGWASGLTGSLIVGGNSEETLGFIREQTLESVKSALSDLQPARISFGESQTTGLIVNRLNRESGPIDETLRQLNFEKPDGERAGIYSYQAHTVFLSKDKNELSADYPSAFLPRAIQRDSLDMAAFLAGAMGSHTPVIEDRDDSYEAMQAYGEHLAEFVDSSIKEPLDSLNGLEFYQVPVQLPPATIRISENWKLKEGIFNSIMGNYPSEITVFRLGRILLIGIPIELSGEYNLELSKIAKDRGLDLVITCFNGTYLGYAPRDHYYNEVSKAETRSMNWYGPHSGSYFKQLIEEIILTF